MNEQKKEKLMELFETAILNFQGAETSLIYDRDINVEENLEKLQKEVNEAIEEFREVLYNEKESQG